MSDSWLLRQPGFRAATARAWEGLFTLGAHGLHLRGSWETPLAGCPQNRADLRRPANVTSEQFDDAPTRWGTFVAGVFAPHPLLGNELVNLPWFLELTPVVDGRAFDPRDPAVESSRTLDLRRALLTTDARWRVAGATLTLRWTRFVSAAHPGCCVQRLTLTSDAPVRVTLQGGIDADIRTNGHDHFRRVLLASPAPGTGRCRIETDGEDSVTIDSTLHFVSTEPDQPSIDPFPAADSLAPLQTDFAVRGRRLELAATLPLEPGRPLTCCKVTRVSTSRDLAPHPPAPNDLRALFADHAAAWEARWQSCDVQIDGDPDAQRAARIAIFHLLRSHVDDPRVAIDPKGYSGEAYWGRFFWDTELFLLPFYLYTDPARARSLVDFRVRALPAAIENARRYGDPGARYPWESDGEGRECCPNWQYADHEIHVTADVVYGLAHYAAAAPDRPFLRGPAARVLVETARYWMARIDTRDGRPVLLGVMGPDEYAPFTDNNAWTNRMVRFALETAADESGADAAECDAWRAVAAALPIPRHPDDPRLVLQCDGYHLRPALPFERYWRDRSHTLGSQVAQERLYRSRCPKQADVLMLMAIFPGEFSRDELRAAWDEYTSITTHDSSLSPGIHALVALRLGLHEPAWQFWQRAAQLDQVGESTGNSGAGSPGGGAAEGVHAANCGAIWQVLVFGFAGVHNALQSAELRLAPRLPAHWNRLAFPLVWRGTPLHVEITHTSVTICNRGPAPLRATVDDEPRDIAPLSTAAWPRKPAQNP